MRKMGFSSAEDIPAMQEIVLEFRAGKMVFYGKKVNQALGRVYILKFNTDDRKSLFGCRSQKLKMILNCVALSTIILIVHFGGPRDVMIHVAGSSGDPDEDLLQSHPFRQQMDSFTYVLRTGQIDLSQFEINPSKCEWSVAPEPVA
ncbi:hypothetical protein POTOM_056619 [Populus tomentosa]|uniref:Uncharacterized protein n=1 Tax=Populus tomentosa TaxID=118781 RepID=A0A8X7XYQ0_POPTO|nr:hypothetical protein POTOM_056619 [Populus tomentosa]